VVGAQTETITPQRLARVARRRFVLSVGHSLLAFANIGSGRMTGNSEVTARPSD
jgi:hypothetical protein